MVEEADGRSIQIFGWSFLKSPVSGDLSSFFERLINNSLGVSTVCEKGMHFGGLFFKIFIIGAQSSQAEKF